MTFNKLSALSLQQKVADGEVLTEEETKLLEDFFRRQYKRKKSISKRQKSYDKWKRRNSG